MKKMCTKLKNFVQNRFPGRYHLKRTLMLALVSLVGYCSLNYSMGPGNNGQAVSGAPFDYGMTCNSCHSPGTSYNATLTIELLDGTTPVTSYTPGNSYTVRITRSADANYNSIQDAGFGFQMTCATGAGYDNYDNWGTLPNDVADILVNGRNYVEHSIKLPKNINQLDFPWTAPNSPTAGDARFYVSLNTVNGDGTNSNDEVINDSLVITAPSFCPTPNISLSASSTTICSGNNVTFTANPTNGGNSPSYIWMINGSIISGETNSTFTTSTLNDNDFIKVVMTPEAPCNISSATSNTVTISVNSNVTPDVNIFESTNNICSGAPVMFTSSFSNEGNNPGFQWKVNGIAISGETNDTYTSSNLNNGDTISLELTSSVSCYTTQKVTSNEVVMIVNTNVTPTVSISASSSTICAGSSVTFSSTTTNGGNNPSYQWMKNGNAINGATNNSYTTTSLSNGDILSLMIMSSASCYTTQNANSNAITMTVNSNVTPTVNISASSSTICAGSSVTFSSTTTNGGNNPSYQWMENGNAINGATNNSYTTTSLSNGDILSLMIMSSASCYTTQNANSNAITMTVNSNVTPTVSISASSSTICAGSSVTFSSNTTNEGNNPTYQWVKNGNAINGATNNSFITSSLSDGDVFSLNITSNANCITNSNAFSNSTSITVNQTLGNITSSGPLALCNGGSVNLSTGNGTNYLWSNGATTQSITTNLPGNYSVEYKDNNGCTVTTSPISVFNKSLPTILAIQVNGLNTVCSPNNVSFGIAGGNSSLTGFYYQWNLAGSPIAGATNPDYFATNGGGNVSLTISGSNCTKTSSAKPYLVKPRPSASFTAGGPTTFCAGGSVTLSAPSISGYSYAWTLNGVSAGGGMSKVVKVSGLYSVIAKSGGCSDTAINSVSVSVNSLPIASLINLTATTFCTGDSCVLQANPNGGTIYKWLNGTSVIASTNVNTYATYITGSYKVIVTDTNSCTSKASTTSVKTKANLVPVATISASTSVNIPILGSVKLNAFPTMGVTWQWYKNGLSISGATSKQYIATSAGNYTVGISKLNCTGFSAATVVTQSGLKIGTDLSNENSFSITAFPNPVHEILQLNVEGVNSSTKATIEIIDMLGNIISKIDEEINYTLDIDMSKFISGNYLIRYKDNDNHSSILKITKQ